MSYTTPNGINNYVDVIKNQDPVENAVMLLLSLKFPNGRDYKYLTISDIARLLDISRQSIYNVIERHKQEYEDYCNGRND